MGLLDKFFSMKLPGKEMDTNTRVDTSRITDDYIGTIEEEYSKTDSGRVKRPKAENEMLNTILGESVEFFQTLDDTGAHQIKLLKGRGTLQEYIDEGLLAPEQVADIIHHCGEKINPNLVLIPGSIYVDKAGKDIISIWNSTSTIEEIIGQRAHSYFSKMSRYKEFVSDVKLARTLYENATGDVSEQSMTDWFVNCAVAYALQRAQEEQYHQGILRHLKTIKNYAQNILKKVECLKNMVQYKQINEAFIKYLDQAIFSKTSEWDKLRESFRPLKLANPERSMERALRIKSGEHYINKFEKMRYLNSFNLTPETINTIADKMSMTVETLTDWIKEKGEEKFRQVVDKNFSFSIDGKIKESYFDLDKNPEIRLWIRSQEPEAGKGTLSTQIFDKESTTNIVKQEDKGKESGGFEM